MIIKSETLFQCDKCGSEIRYSNERADGEGNNFNGSDLVKKNRCWSIRMGRAGYGSKLDGSEVNFDICDDCLVDFVRTFKYKERIYKSGSNYYYDDEE